MKTTMIRRAMLGLGLLAALLFGYTVAGYRSTAQSQPVAQQLSQAIEPQAEAICNTCLSLDCGGPGHPNSPNCCGSSCKFCTNWQNDVNNCGGCGYYTGTGTSQTPHFICDPYGLGPSGDVSCINGKCRVTTCDHVCQPIAGYQVCEGWTCGSVTGCSAPGCSAVALGTDCSTIDGQCYWDGIHNQEICTVYVNWCQG